MGMQDVQTMRTILSKLKNLSLSRCYDLYRQRVITYRYHEVSGDSSCEMTKGSVVLILIENEACTSREPNSHCMIHSIFRSKIFTFIVGENAAKIAVHANAISKQLKELR